MISPLLLLKRSIKSAAAFAQILRARKENSVTIIGYHRVVADIATAEENSIYGLVVSAETFREHCRILKENFDVVTLDEAAEFLERGEFSHQPKAVITFDDGYADNYELAFPILRELDLPATIFLPTMLVGQSEPLAHDKAFWLAKNAIAENVDFRAVFRNAGVGEANLPDASADVLDLTDRIVYLPATRRDEIIAAFEEKLSITEYPQEYKLLNWDQVREMKRRGIAFGDHTATHPVLPLEDESAFAAEIFESKRVLERELGADVTTFAYPNGRYNAVIRNAIVEAGYRVGVTTDKHVNKFGDDLFALGRTCLCEESTRGFGGRFSPQVAKLRFGVGSNVAATAYSIFFENPLEKLLALSAGLSALTFLL